jgi:putative ABC transport system ATP-binding protein
MWGAKLPMGNKAVLDAKHLTKTFGSGHTAVHAVEDVSLTVSAGELALVMGPSGSGKTTLLSMLGGLLTPDSGTVTISGTDISALDESRLPGIRAQSVGFIFQAFNLLDALTVEENILFPSLLIKEKQSTAAQRAYDLIERLHLVDRRKALPRTLSGGEKQRVAIARALINEPPLILADEPTGNLDSATGQEVMMILHDIARDEGRSILLVTHDPRVEDVADRILWLEDGTLRDRKAEQHSWVRDPVCGMRVDKWIADVKTIHEGKEYVFCTKRCLERFEETPQDYLRNISRDDSITDSIRGDSS